MDVRIVVLAISLCLLSGAMCLAQEKPIAVYKTRLGEQDHFNSKGKELKSAAGIIRQDRANYHRFQKRDPQDEYDPVFSDKDNRAQMEDMLGGEDGIPPKIRNNILHGTPLIEVTVYKNRLYLELLDEGDAFIGDPDIGKSNERPTECEIRYARINGLGVGDKISKLASALPKGWSTKPEPDEMFPGTWAVDENGKEAILFYHGDGKVIDQIEVHSAACRTPGGIGLQSTMKAVASKKPSGMRCTCDGDVQMWDCSLDKDCSSLLVLRLDCAGGTGVAQCQGKENPGEPCNDGWEKLDCTVTSIFIVP